MVVSFAVENPIGSPIEPNKFIKGLWLLDVYILLQLLFINLTFFSNARQPGSTKEEGGNTHMERSGGF